MELRYAFLMITQILLDSFIYHLFSPIYPNYTSNHPRYFPYSFPSIQRLLHFDTVYSNTWTANYQMFKLVLDKAEEPEIKWPTSAGSWKKQKSSRKASISSLLTMPKPLTTCVDHNNLWKILKEMRIPDHLTCLLRLCMQVRKQRLELDMEQQTGSK